MSAPMSDRRADQLPERLTDESTIVAPGVTDALSARFAASMGFEAVHVGGHVMGQMLGMTEPLITATETIDFARNIAESVEVPVIDDGNAIFRDLLHCRCHGAAFGQAGVAAVHVEAQVCPKRTRYFVSHDYVVERRHAVEEIRFAVRAARKDHDIVVIGRTDAREAQGGGYEEAAARCNAFLEEGAEIVMPYATCAPDAEAGDVVRRIDDPTLYVSSEGGTEHATLPSPGLEQLSWRVVIFSLSAMMASVRAVGAMLEHLRDFGSSGVDLHDVARTWATLEGLAHPPEMYDVECVSGRTEVHRA